AMLHPIKKCILFETNKGEGIADLPKYLYDIICSDDRYNEYEKVWVVSTKKSLKKYKKKGYSLILKDSDEYIEYLATSKYLITNWKLPYYYVRRDEQIYINTTKGMLLKKSAYDKTEGRVDDARVLVRTLLNSTAIISQSKEHYNTIIKGAYKIDNIYSGKILNAEGILDEYIESIDKNQVVNDIRDVLPDVDKPIILFLINKEDINMVKQKVEQSGLNDKYHFIIIKDTKQVYRGVDLQVIAKASYALITGSANLAYSFVKQNKPVLLLGEISDYYNTEYLDKCNFVKTYDEALNEIEKFNIYNDCEHGNIKENFAKNTYIGKRLIETIFDGDESIEVIKQNETLEKILICTNLSTKVQTQYYLKAFLENIDYSKYDVTLVSPKVVDPKQQDFVNSLNRNVRIIYRAGALSTNEADYIKTQYLIYNMLYLEDISEGLKEIPRELMKREKRRIFGDVKFDVLIEAGDVNALWLMLFSDSEIKKIALNIVDYFKYDNDLISEAGSQRYINIRKLYDRYDVVAYCDDYNYERAYNDELMNKNDLVKLSMPVGNNLLENDKPLTSIEYKGKVYNTSYISGNKNRGGRIKLFPAPNKAYNKNYIIQSTNPDLEKVLKYASKQADINVEVLLNALTIDIENCAGYIKQFDGYICTMDKYDEFRAACDMLDREVYMFDNEIKKVTTKLFDNREDYRKYINKEIEDLLCIQ
ncbi:MAG: CDP-glycerol glycerophosphotransferase family protein, partial [Eubacterium sp.]